MLKSDSREIEPGDVFITLAGHKHDGHDFIEEAIRNGASRIIAERGEYDVETMIVASTYEYLNEYLHDNIPNIKIIGVTGTNGKTTTCYLIWKICELLSIPCAYIGTLGFFLGDKKVELKNTTPGLLELYQFILESHEAGCQYIVMEVSSQALSEGRVAFIDFDYAIFTNLTQDHLDYHITMESYLEAKKQLFEQVKKDGISILNQDDPCSSYFQLGNYVTYGYSESDYQLEGENLSFSINEEEYHMKLLGKYNIYNMSAAICFFYQLGFNHEELKEVIILCDSPEGRLDVIEHNTNKIIIDYAHTPDALSNVLDCVAGIPHNKIITIVGCGGDRDKTKRPIMGDIATKKSDLVIFTSDNPRSEDPEEILNDITKSLDISNYKIESSRENAIKKGIQSLTNNDILMVLGKGHEKYQIIGNERFFFDDKKIVLDNL